MHKTLPTIAALLCAAVLTLAAREIHFKGGYLTTIDDTQVESFGDDMNFMFAYRFSDGSIHLNHSKGIHTVTEYGCSDMSLDNGYTWQNNVPGGTMGINTFEGLNGEKFQVGCWATEHKNTHTVTLTRYNDDTHKKETVATCQVEMPQPSSFLMHRDVIRLKSGKLLATVYGNIKGHKKAYCFVIESTDDGRTWRYLSTIADDLEGKTAEGPDEATIFQLKDGRVCAFYRDGGMDYLHQCFSADEGKTWSAPEKIDLFKGAASPNGRVLADGTIVVISGRPNVYLLIDMTGTGRNYQKINLYRGSGSSYATVLETAPNEILCLYDESNFGSWTSATPFSRIHASRFKVSRHEGVHVNDPLAAKYDFFFRPTTLDKITGGGAPIASGYKRKDKFPDALATMEVVEIPERPHPVLRLVSHGTKEGGGEWASFSGATNLIGVKKARVATEFRLGDMAETRPQFHILVTVGATDEDKGYLAFVRVATDRIEMSQADSDQLKVLPYDIGTTKFHAFVLEGDAEAGTASLYIEGQDKPIMTVSIPKALGAPSVSIGDGSAAIYGSADVSYFGWAME